MINGKKIPKSVSATSTLSHSGRGVGDFAGQVSTESAAACVCCVVQCVAGKTTPKGFHCVKVTMSAVSSR